MVDVDVRLGLSGSDLALRERTWKADLSRRGGVPMPIESLPEFGPIEKSGAEITELQATTSHGIDVLYCRPDAVVTILRALRDDAGFALLSDLFGIDTSGLGVDHSFEIVYSLFRLTDARRFLVKAVVRDSAERVPTASVVWPAANWPEREIFDMFGVVFEGHPDLRRILMPDDWIGHPLRKDFPLGGEEVEFSHNVRLQ